MLYRNTLDSLQLGMSPRIDVGLRISLKELGF
jgi:hypothetical protein